MKRSTSIAVISSLVLLILLAAVVIPFPQDTLLGKAVASLQKDTSSASPNKNLPEDESTLDKTGSSEANSPEEINPESALLSPPDENIPAQTSSSSNKISPYVLEKLEMELSTEVVLYLEDPFSGGPLSSEEANTIVQNLDPTKTNTDYLPDAIVTELFLTEVNALAQNPRVKYIVPFIILTPQLQDSVEIIGATQTWNTQIEGTYLTGEGQTICVIDTGVDFDHPDLINKNIAGGNFDCFTPFDFTCPLDLTTTDTSGHGTHVSGIAAAEGGINGIAKGANIISVKVFPDGGNPTTNNVAVRWAINKCMDLADEYNIAAITISIGFPGLPPFQTNCDSYDQAMTDAINNAFDNSIPVTISSGNGGSSTEIYFPSCITKAIPVAATLKDDSRWIFSNYNSLVKLFAPGVLITSTCSSEQPEPCDDGIYDIKTGTSMSTPMVAGSIAIIQQSLELTGQSMTPEEIEQLLFDSGEQITDLPFEDYRRINIFRGINYCQTDNDCISADACNPNVCNTQTNQCEIGPPVNCNNQPGWVNSAYKINESRFGNGNELDGDTFGNAIANLGDLDGDGIQDIAVGEPINDDGGESNGAVWILFLNESGGVKDEYKINEAVFGNGNELSGDAFGSAIANLGDLDGDGIQDIAVGERRNDDGGVDNGAVWILFLNQDGSVKDEYKINEAVFGTGNELDGDWFGYSLANLGDLDGDGIVDLAVGEYFNDDGGTNNGAVWILFLNQDGSVKDEYKINESRFGNGNELDGDNFGGSLANLGDLDGDGIVDLAVGEFANDDGGHSNGAVWILFLNESGGVKDEYKINESRFGNGNELDEGIFGFSVANLGDLDGDGIQDLAVGERLNDDGGLVNGAVWILFLNQDGSVKDEYKINESRFGNGNELDSDFFGSSLANLGDLNGDGVVDLAVGEDGNDDGGPFNGAVWILFLDGVGSPPVTCPADLNDDETVGAADLAMLLGSWGDCPETGSCPADFDNTGTVGAPDLAVLLGSWGECPT